ncbi:MAG: ParB/RepB/Spo0J family partition protein [Pseudomonadota bacterium]
MQNLTPKGQEAQTTDHNGNGMELKLVNIDSITIPNHHPRTDYGNLETLLGSIKRDGLQEPLLVYEIEVGKFGIIDGARRLKAVQDMGLKQICCLINKVISEADAAHLSYVKNVERNTLSVIEIARHIKVMRDDFGYTLSELELKGYGSPATISNKLTLLDLPDKVQVQIQNGTLTAGHGLAIAKLPTQEEQVIAAKRIVKDDMTVKKTEGQIERYLSKQSKPSKDKSKEIIPSNNIAGVYFKDARDMSELDDKSVHLIVSSPLHFHEMDFAVGMTSKEFLENIEAVMKEIARVIIPGGIIALNVADVTHTSGNIGAALSTVIKLVGHTYQSCLRKNGVYLTDEIVWAKPTGLSAYQNDDKTYNSYKPHTSYRIKQNWEHIYIFRAKGMRKMPSEEIISQSKLTNEQYATYVNGIWEIEPVSNNEGRLRMYPDELVNRLIRMFSYVGDTVLDPFLGSGTSVKVARELERVGIGYERELKYKPVIMEKLGLMPEETAVKSTTMAEYKKQTLQPEVDVNGFFDEANIAEEEKEDEQGEVNASKPEAEFFSSIPQHEIDKIKMSDEAPIAEELEEDCFGDESVEVLTILETPDQPKE